MTTNANAPVEKRHADEAVTLLNMASDRVRTHAQTLANLEAANNRLAEIDPTPWANFHGDLPDYDHPLRPVYESGIQYAVNLLAKVLDVTDYEVCDGTEEFDGDLGGTLGNIVLAAMPKDEHGDPIWPKDLHTPSPCPGCAAKDEAMAELRADLVQIDQIAVEGRWGTFRKSYGTRIATIAAKYRPPADPLAEELRTLIAKHGVEMSEAGFEAMLAWLGGA